MRGGISNQDQQPDRAASDGRQGQSQQCLQEPKQATTGVGKETESVENATLAEYPAEEIAALGQTLMTQVEGETCGRIAAAGGLLLRDRMEKNSSSSLEVSRRSWVLQHVGGFSVSYGFV